MWQGPFRLAPEASVKHQTAIRILLCGKGKNTRITTDVTGDSSTNVTANKNAVLMMEAIFIALKVPLDQYGDTVFVQPLQVAAQDLQEMYHEPGYEGSSARKHWQTRESAVGSIKISEASFIEMVNEFNRRFNRAPARTIIVDFHSLALYDAEDEQGLAP